MSPFGINWNTFDEISSELFKPSLVIGSAVAGALSMWTQTALRAPHGGIFLLPIPGAVVNYTGYAIALTAGVIVSALLLGILKQSTMTSAEQQTQ